MKNKLGHIVLIVILIIAIVSNLQLVQASGINKNSVEIKTELKEVSKQEKDQANIKKQILNVDNAKKELIMQLEIENTFNKNTQIVFVIDDSGSMETRKETVVNSAIELAKYLYNKVSDVQIGAVSFNDNALIKASLTKDESSFARYLQIFKTGKPNGGTNTVAGLETAKNMITSNDSQKVIVLLTDGIPNSPEETKNKLKSIQTQGIDLFSIIIDMNGASVIQDVFGTVQTPTAGRLYDIALSSMQQVSNEINQLIQKETSGVMQNVKLKDYFPQEIVDNFDFELISTSKGVSTGTIKDGITWEIDNIQRGEKIQLQYKLKLKNEVNSEIIDKVIQTNSDVTVDYKDAKNGQKSIILDNQPKIRLIIKQTDHNNNINNNSTANNNIVNNTTENNNNIGNNNGSTNTNNSVTNDNKVNNNKKNNINGITKLPQTGEFDIPVLIAIISVIGIIAYIRYQKYKEI